MRTRPFGVSLISGLSMFLSFILTPMFLGSFCMLTEFTSDTTGVAIRIAMFYQIILGLAVGIGFLDLKKWAYQVAVVGYSVSTVLNLILFGLPLTLVGSISFLAPVAVLVYLRQPRIQQVFRIRM